MRRYNIKVGREYLTRDITVNGAFGPYRTRGHVCVLGEDAIGYHVKWLMRDGSERMDSRLPTRLLPRQIWTEVRTDG